MSYQPTLPDGYQLPPGMMLVAAPQQQPMPMYNGPSQQPMPMYNGPSQQPQVYPTISQYQPPTIINNNSLKNNKVAPPPPTSMYHTQTASQPLPLNCI